MNMLCMEANKHSLPTTTRFWVTLNQRQTNKMKNETNIYKNKKVQRFLFISCVCVCVLAVRCAMYVECHMSDKHHMNVSQIKFNKRQYCVQVSDIEIVIRVWVSLRIFSVCLSHLTLITSVCSMCSVHVCVCVLCCQCSWCFHFVFLVLVGFT